MDSGWVTYEDEHGRTYAKECDCGLNEKEREERKLRFANVPITYRDVKLKNVKASMYTNPDSKLVIKAVMESIKYWLDHFDAMKENGKGLYFFSKAKGSGKTMTAAALANELIERGEKVKFATSMQIISEIKSSWDKEQGVSESQLMYDLSHVDVLVIDDFGTETVKDWISEKFYNIINTRYIEKKITIFTSNDVIRNLDYDERITNRITERCFKVHFPEESVRETIGQIQERELKGTRV